MSETMKHHIKVQGTEKHKLIRNMTAFVLYGTIVGKNVISFFYI